ncbi:DUF3060 domain-containing protein [Microbacterium sp. 5K110]|uniref:DUF3060 domain-containing protein n=1 Tax=unclassified Microbacterium TaxID=2609290 RepID=UPI0010FF076D|nr:DUF3060 domain-containing protein [Microbacterium sp. 5K110]TLF34485.1 DUF3060 domain-containing protein [Microbacterium sp. 5K110]
MNRRARLAASVIGVLVGVSVLVGCGLAPQPVITRLPPPATSGTSSSAVPTPSNTPSVEAAPSTAPSRSPDSARGAADGALTDCGDGGTASVNGGERAVRVEGTCAQLTVSGSALTVDASGATIGVLTLAGDRIRVVAASIDSATSQGNDSALAVAGAVGRLDLSGDRATVTVGGAISSLLVRGQDNTVTAAGGIGESAVEGRGNRIG